MAITITEVLGRELSKGQSPSGKLQYELEGTDSHTIAYGLILAASPIVFDSLIKQNVKVHEIGPYLWLGEVTYGTLGDGDEPDWSFEVSAQQKHITQAIEHVQHYNKDGPGIGPGHKGAIGVQRSGAVSGTDIVFPFMTWEETHWMPILTFTQAYTVMLESHVATVNEEPWRIWNKGEIILMGVSGQKRGAEDVGLTFRFAVSRTKTNFSIGDVISIDKEGHHYLWLEYERVANPILPIWTDRVKAVHVEQVYEYSDFDELALSDPYN